MGSGRVPTCVGLVVVLAALVNAPIALGQPVRRVSGLIEEPFGTVSLPTDGGMPAMSPVPPRTAYQPPRDPGEPGPPEGIPIPVLQSKGKRYFLGLRYGTEPNGDTRVSIESTTLADGTKRVLITGGVVINVASIDGAERSEFATDNAVAWIRGAASKQPSLDGLVTTGGDEDQVEIYMSGNVVIRTTRGAKSKNPSTETLRAEEIYYDAQNNKAIAVRGDLEMALPNTPDAFHLRGEEIRRLDLENWEILHGSASASKLPSDPGLRLDSQRFTLSERDVVRRNIFGLPFRDIRTGEVVETRERIVTGTNVVTRLAGVPTFFLPVLRADATDPLGPFQGFGFGQSRIFGTQLFTTWDLYELLALRPPPDHKWRLNLDYMSKRGPAVGSNYSYLVPGEEPGDPYVGAGMVKLYGLYDRLRQDILGGYRGPQPNNPFERGRVLWRHQQEITDDLYFQGQFAQLSDKNFLEEFYKNDFDLGPNQETFAYLQWQHGIFGATGLFEDRINRTWVTETNWLPRVDGQMYGLSFLDDLFQYNARASAAYAQLMPTKYNPYPLLVTDQQDSTGRFDLWQELNLPLALGPVKFAPYGIVELTDYTNDLNGNEVGRVYGAGGARASLPFSRLYGDVNSEIFNLRGLNHKILFGANYRYARTNVHYTQLPQLDRLNDDSTDETWRYITPIQTQLVPGPAGIALMNSPSPANVFNPQAYAIRRVVENRIDTLDDINVLQLDMRQRFQTKRGYPGMEHTVDFFTFDLSASYFPQPTRNNFGHPFSFLEYQALWNPGDRTAVVANGWFEPYQGGSRYWNAGVYFNRTDRTNLYLGYRQTDPLNSKTVTTSVGYQLSHRYYANISASYDFGLQQSISNTVMFTRTGTDLTVSIGFTYNALVNTFGFQFMVLPNLVQAFGGGTGGYAPLSGSGLSNRR